MIKYFGYQFSEIDKPQIETCFHDIMSKKTRAISFGIFVGIFLLSYTIGTTYKMNQDEATQFLKDFQSQNAGIDSFGIFFHNASVALPMFVPAFGSAWGAFTGWQTGAAFEAVMIASSSSTTLPPVALLLLTPFGVLELGAYSIGMSRSFLLIWRIIKRKSMKDQIKPSLIEIGIVIALLMIGGFVESSMMSQHVSLSA
ncbi:MAG TPA: stage II sporulation protein M [Verrucomicrobiae bacterium]|nr:stage II sporulation protein M [Verrucomicrobiae bacterium]